MVDRITCLYGGLGSGKTAEMIRNAVIDYYSGRILLANFHFRKMKYFYIRISQLMDLMKMLNPNRQYSLFIDEIQAEGLDYTNMFSPKSRTFKIFIAQIRKRNIKLYYATQFRTGANPNIREITDVLIRCQAIRDKTEKDEKKNLIEFRYTKMDYNQEPSSINPYKFKVPKAISSMFWDYYETEELIDEDVDNDVIAPIEVTHRYRK